MKQSALIIFLAVCVAAAIGSFFAPAEAVEPPPAYTVPAVFNQAAAGGLHTCGVHTDGAVTCRGNDDFGQSTPPDGIFTQVSAGAFHTCGILQADSSVVCWGDDSLNQITDTPAGSFTQISAGEYYTCGILQADSSVVCWGDNSFNQITDTPADTFTQVSAGANHACGILQADSSVVCWGYDSSNQVSGTPAGIFTKVEAGGLHACGILQADSSVVCWGSGTTNTGSEPEYGQSMPPAGIFADISAGGYHTCGRLSDQSIVCWGAGTTVGGEPEFGQSIPPGGTFSGISAGRYHTCGVRTDQLVACWGDNSDGQSTMPIYRSVRPSALWVSATADGLGNVLVTAARVGTPNADYYMEYKKTTDTAWTFTGSLERTQNVTLPSYGLYQFRVKVVDSTGAIADSAWTAGDQDCVFTNVPAPTMLTATAFSSNEIDITWEAYGGADSLELQMQPGTSCSVTPRWITIATITDGSTTFRNGDLIPTGIYAYRIRAIVGGLASPWSTHCVVATTPVTARPTNLAVTGNIYSTVNLSWQDNTSNEVRFTLQRKVGAVCDNSGWTVASYPGTNVTTFTDSNRAPNTTYTYRIRTNVGVSTVWPSAWSDCVTVTTPSIPDPGDISATGITDTGLTINWTDLWNSESSFTVQRRAGADCNGVDWTLTAYSGANTTAYNDTGLTPSTTYSYRVRANFLINGIVTPSAWSNCMTATTAVVAAPAAPTWGTATAISAASISLVWNDNSSNETSFELQRKTGATCNNAGWVQVAVPAANATTFQNNNLAVGATYSYRIRALSGSGNSAFSTCATASTFAAATDIPAAPSGLIATQGAPASGQIVLNWTDNQTDTAAGSETRFFPEKANGTCPVTGWTAITSAPTNVTTVTATGFTTGNVRSFRVRAFNAAGYSTYSNCVTQTAP